MGSVLFFFRFIFYSSDFSGAGQPALMALKRKPFSLRPVLNYSMALPLAGPYILYGSIVHGRCNKNMFYVAPNDPGVSRSEIRDASC